MTESASPENYAESESLDVMFTHIRPSIDQQLATSDHLDFKARTIYLISIAVIGFTAPFALTQLREFEPGPTRELWTQLLFAPSVIFLLSTSMFLWAYWPRNYAYIDNPAQVLRLANEEPKSAKSSLIELTARSYKQNLKHNNSKGNALTWQARVFALQTVLSLGHLFVVLALPLW